MVTIRLTNRISARLIAPPLPVADRQLQNLLKENKI
jgi:hypothetical protein